MRIWAILATSVLLLAGCSQGNTEESPAASNLPSAAATESAMEPQASSESEPEQAEAEKSPATEAAEESSAATSPAAEAQPTEGQTTQPAEPSAQPTTEASPEPTLSSEPEVVGYPISDVAQRSTQTDCWVAISGSVYDLTDWIRRHPGGSAAILSLCGTDATSQFQSQHGGASRPASELAGYLIGPLLP